MACSRPRRRAWMAIPIDERRAQLAAAARRQFGDLEKPTLRIALPDAPGARILLNRLASDWGAIGITVEAVETGEAADFGLIDKVAPSTSPAWFVRSFRCGEVPVCDPEADELMDGARSATVAVQRNGLLAQAAQRIDDQQLFIALTAPIRWSLVSDRVQGFATNRFAPAYSDVAAPAARPGAGRLTDRRTPLPGLGSDPASVRQRVEALEKIMERLFVIPGTNRAVGPRRDPRPRPVCRKHCGRGARRLHGVGSAQPRHVQDAQMARMAGNVGVDWALGLIPWIGAVPDLFFRSNSRNLRIIKRHLDKHHPAAPPLRARLPAEAPEQP